MKKIFERRIVPIAVIERADDAVPVAEALMAGGLDIIEVTFRTADAEKAIQRIVKALPDMLVGAGTILSVDQVQRAVDAGAKFGVSPGLNDRVLTRTLEIGLPFIPGVLTPSEVERALERGLKLLKLFPAEQAGGLNYLKALAGPYEHTGVKFIPLGGINLTNASDYLALPIVGAIGGSWLVDKRVISARNWKEITVRAQEAVKTLRQ